MKIDRIPVGVYSANCYILMDETTRESAVIDPGGDSAEILKKINEMKAEIKYILLTHGHLDHTGAVVKLKKTFNVPVCLKEEDEKLMLSGEVLFTPASEDKEPFKADSYITENSVLKLGNHEITCIETPGHTPGGVCFLIDKLLFTGDTLFSGSIGRTDFPQGNFDALIDSIKGKLLALSDEVVVFPGHGLETNIGEERNNNPFL